MAEKCARTCVYEIIFVLLHDFCIPLIVNYENRYEIFRNYYETVR